MGYVGKLRLKRKAIKLRKKGFSYSEIKKEMDVSKSTLSLWCRDVAISEDQALRLYKRKLEGAERGRIIGAKRQQKMRIERTKQLVCQGIGEVKNMTKRERFYAGVGLYLGDGAKGDRNVDFSNTNPDIIYFMMQWFRDFCNVSESRFRGSIWIHDGLDVKVAKNFWSKLTGIPENQFSKTYVARLKKDSDKIRKKHHEYDVFKIRICKVSLQREIRGWMAGILGVEEVK